MLTELKNMVYIISVFKNSENQILKNCGIEEEKKGVRMLDESPCMYLVSFLYIYYIGISIVILLC